MVEITNDAMDEDSNPSNNAVAANLIHFVAETPPEDTPEIPREVEVSSLHQCFHAVLLRRKVRISFAAYKYMVQYDLEVPEIATMNEADVTVLAKSLNFFMTQWPGWAHRFVFVDGPTPITAWYDDYKAFLSDRVRYIVTNMETLWESAIADHFKESLTRQQALADGEVIERNNETETLEVKPDTNTFDCSVQTDQLEFAPYHLAFSGQPAVLNSLYFVITKSGKGSARFHEPLKLETISVKQLLNSPYVLVNVTLPELSFGRKMDHKYTRFTTTRPLKKGLPSTEDKIICVNRMDSSKYDTVVYSYIFLNEYFEQFFRLLRKHKFITEERTLELETIAEEFLRDIADCNLYDSTMATNMSVTFRLGGHTYVRNKTWRQGSHGSISYVERIDPRSTFFLKSCSAEQDGTTAEPSFKLLNKIDRAISNNDNDCPEMTQFLEQLRDIQNSISYSCTLCEKVFSYYQLLYTHYRVHHGGEQAVLCEVCSDKQNMLILTTKRWDHRCKEQPKGEPMDNTVVPSSSTSGYNTANGIANAVGYGYNDDASSSKSGAGSFLNALMVKEEEITKEEEVTIDIDDEMLNGDLTMGMNGIV